MTWYFSYIGDLDDPGFQWDTPPASPSKSNLPRRLVPAADHISIGASVFALMERLKAGAPNVRRLDWGAFGARMTGAELVALFGAAHPCAAEIVALDPARYYVLVAGEGG